MNNDLIKYTLIISAILILLAILFFNEISFIFLGFAIVIIGIIILYKINQ